MNFMNIDPNAHKVPRGPIDLQLRVDLQMRGIL